MLVRGCRGEHDISVVVERQLAGRRLARWVPREPYAARPAAGRRRLRAGAHRHVRADPTARGGATAGAAALPGATGVQGRYGVVAGERRTTVWAYTVDPGDLPVGRAPRRRAGRAGVRSRRWRPASEPRCSAGRRERRRRRGQRRPSRAFRHGGLALLVEGTDPPSSTRWSRLGSTALGGAEPRYSWTSSIRVPKLPFGWTKATVVPRLPGRGASSIGGGAGRDHRREGRGAVVDPVADVVQALAALLDRLGDRRVVAGRRAGAGCSSRRP